MGQTIIEKIISNHCGKPVKPGDIVDIIIDVRLARDFGGANVVKNIEENKLDVDDPTKTFFTFDCNPGGSDQKYAANQQICRLFARKTGVKVFDVNQGIGTHIAIDEGLAYPGCTLVSTDSHANILGAIGAFGQGMGDQDIAYAWSFGKVWFEVPPTVKIILKGKPSKLVTPKDVVLRLLKQFGANGLLGFAAELYGDYIEDLDLSGRITIASMATEMGAIIILFPPSKKIIDYCKNASGKEFAAIYSDQDAKFHEVIEIDISDLKPLISLPGNPENVVEVDTLNGQKVDSVFVGSCTNGRFEDMLAVANVLKNKKVAPGVVLKIVPSTDAIWKKCLQEGLLDIFKKAGALVSNAGCAGCADGQVGQNGPNEVTVSTGNRNFTGKQGKGAVYLASPETAAASAVSGVITSADKILEKPVIFQIIKSAKSDASRDLHKIISVREPFVEGRVWVIPIDNIDTDMIFHNRHLAITNIEEMGKFAFGNLKGWEDFPQKAKKGDIIVTGKNFGAGSSRQQAVDCFKSLGIGAIIAESFGAIYERNAINAAFPILVGNLKDYLKDGDLIKVDFSNGKVIKISDGAIFHVKPFSNVQMEIYKRGGLLIRS